MTPATDRSAALQQWDSLFTIPVQVDDTGEAEASRWLQKLSDAVKAFNKTGDRFRLRVFAVETDEAIKVGNRAPLRAMASILGLGPRPGELVDGEWRENQGTFSDYESVLAEVHKSVDKDGRHRWIEANYPLAYLKRSALRAMWEHGDGDGGKLSKEFMLGGKLRNKAAGPHLTLTSEPDDEGEMQDPEESLSGGHGLPRQSHEPFATRPGTRRSPQGLMPATIRKPEFVSPAGFVLDTPGSGWVSPKTWLAFWDEQHDWSAIAKALQAEACLSEAHGNLLELLGMRTSRPSEPPRGFTAKEMAEEMGCSVKKVYKLHSELLLNPTIRRALMEKLDPQGKKGKRPADPAVRFLLAVCDALHEKPFTSAEAAKLLNDPAVQPTLPPPIAASLHSSSLSMRLCHVLRKWEGRGTEKTGRKIGNAVEWRIDKGKLIVGSGGKTGKTYSTDQEPGSREEVRRAG